MKKIILICVVALALGWFLGYEVLNKADIEAETAWSQVESALQRRFDLIPNLVGTVKGYAAHEKEIFTEIAASRAQIGKMDLSGIAGNDEKMAEFAKANSKFSSALSRLLVVAERYPNLKADSSFLALQSQLEGTENRINVERGRYNQAVAGINYYIRNLALSLIAKVHGFSKRAFFKADQEAQKAPTVNFG